MSSLSDGTFRRYASMGNYHIPKASPLFQGEICFSLSALSLSLSNFIALDLEIGVGETSITVLYVNSAFSWLDMDSGLLWILTQLFLTLDNSLHYFLFFVVLFLLKGWERSKPTTPCCKDINKFPNEEWRFSSGGNSYNFHFFLVIF